jgi:hypothetical protein
VRVRNLGTSPAPGVDTVLFVSTDPHLDPTDTLLGSLGSTLPLAPGSSQNLSSSFTLPLNIAPTVGRRLYLIALADRNQSVVGADLPKNLTRSLILSGPPLYTVIPTPRGAFEANLIDPQSILLLQGSGPGPFNYASMASPFSLDIFGQNVPAGTPMRTSRYGYLGFELGSNLEPNDSALNSSWPNAALPNMILAPFWDDLNVSSGFTRSSRIQGLAPNRIWTVEFTDIEHALSSVTGRLSAQVLFYESSSVLRFRYLVTTAFSAASASIGLEDELGLDSVDLTGPWRHQPLSSRHRLSPDSQRTAPNEHSRPRRHRPDHQPRHGGPEPRRQRRCLRDPSEFWESKLCAL